LAYVEAKTIREWRMLSRLQQHDKMKDALLISRQQIARINTVSAVEPAATKTALE
jgi:ribosomal protein L29